MWTNSQVKAADAALPGAPLALATAVAQLNAQTATSSPVDITWSSIRDVLMNNFDWGTLVRTCNTAVGGVLPGGGTQTAAILDAATALRECCLYGGMFNSSVTAVWNRLVAAANLLTPATVGAISSASATAVVALRAPVTAAWSPAITVADLTTIRSGP